MRSGPTANLRRWALRALGVALLLWVAFSFVDTGRFVEALRQLTPLAVTGLVALATLDRWAMAGKWQHLAIPLQIKASFSAYLKAYYGASFLSYALPSTLGGDVYRGWRLSRGNRTPDVVASMAMERALGLLASVLLAAAGVIALSRLATSATSARLGLLVGAGMLLVTVGLAASLHPRVHDLLIGIAGRFRLGAVADRWLSAYGAYRHHFGLLSGNLLFALAEGAVQIAILFLAARALGVEADAVLLISILAVARFVRRLSMLLDGWGFSEALHIVMLGWAGIDGGSALAISLVGHAAGFTASLPGAFLVWSDRREDGYGSPTPEAGSGDDADAPVPDAALRRHPLLRDS